MNKPTDVAASNRPLFDTKPVKPCAYEEADLGFRNHWYPAMLSSHIRETEFKTLTILGEDILFRRVDGIVYAVHDECAHRGFQFSAKPESYTKNTVTCYFHGFTYNIKNGELIGVPSDPSSKLVGKVKLHSYPIQEAKGLIFIFIGDIEPPPLSDDVPPAFLDDTMHIVPFHQEDVHANWRIAADSASEFNHVFMHKDDLLLKYWKQPLPLVEMPKGDNPYEGYVPLEGPGPKGFKDVFREVIPVFEYQFECEGEKGVIRSAFDPKEHQGTMNLGVMEGILVLPCCLRIGPWGANPGEMGGDYYHYEWYVPIDETHHRYIIAWGKYVANAAEALKVEHDVRTRWSYLEYQGFNKSDVLANEGTQRAYSAPGYAFGEKENLSRIDGYCLMWRRMAAKHNRGRQVRYGGKK